ncbi:MAG: vanadium-dependent haloperoxidase [Flavitalea sp.]
MIKKHLLYLAFVILVFTSCENKKSEHQVLHNNQVGRLVNKMGDIMLHDVTNPPLAARFFSYTFLAGYEILSQNDSSLTKLAGKLNKYPALSKPDSITGYDYQVAAYLAMIETASKMQPTGANLKGLRDAFVDSCLAKGCTQETVDNSQRYASAISREMLKYAKTDGYNKISNFPRYSPIEKEGYWFPTPPAFLGAVEPYFNTIRSFSLDSSNEFKPVPPAPFSTDKKSAFYAQMQTNYHEGKPFPADSLLIAAYWDCNPFALQDGGHLQVGLKKISPGAHWLGITGIACGKAGKSFTETVAIHTMVAISLMDGFLACWDEKYRSNRIRPETAIRKYLDTDWKPLLQTPPFPEYPSGHSTISAAAATVLTHYLGENFAYTDTVEVKFGLPTRNFTSFMQAADEAGISRLYGGIHFIDAITNGRTQGIQVAEKVLKRVGD